MTLNEYLSIEGSDIVCRCGRVIGPANDNYKSHVISRVVPLSTAGPHVNAAGVGPGRFVLREFCCPSCLTLLDVEVTLKDEPARWDVQPHLAVGQT